MTDRLPSPDREPFEIDTTMAHPARVYDYLLGGAENFAVDRKAAELHVAANPGGMDAVRGDIKANRAFLGRAVRYLAEEADVRQFLDIGTGLPNEDNVHTVAQRTAPDSRIVYVDNDPIVLAHAHTLLQSTPEGAAGYVDADLRAPEAVLHGAAGTLDFTKPIAVLLIAILHFFGDDEDPYRVVAQLMEAMPSGSYLVISHLSQDIQPEVMGKLAELVENEPTMDYAFTMRSHAELMQFFDGLGLVEPGLVQVDEWQPDDQKTPPPPGVGACPFYGGVARKP